MPTEAELTAAAPDSDDRSWLASEPLLLRESVEQLEGADGRPMLFDAETGRYVAISKTGTAILGLLDGERTGTDLVRVVTDRSAADPAQIEQAVTRFLVELRAAGVFTLETFEADGGRARRIRRIRRTPRLPLTRSASRFLEPPAALLRRMPLSLLLAVIFGSAAACAVFAAVALARRPFGLHPTPWIGVAAAVMLVQIAVHELWHAMVCQYLRTPVREAGITLMLYVMPVAYVDRTDAYRVRSRRARVLIALAGPLSDVYWAGAAGLVLLNAHGAVAAVAAQLLQLQALLMIVNINPLLPSDGYHALESALGAVNLRSRSFGYLTHLITRAEMPSYLRSLGRGRKVGYLCFGLVCAGYGLFMATAILMSWWRVLALVVGA